MRRSPLASATKFAPLALVPLFATYDTARRAGGAGGPTRGPVPQGGGTAVTGPPPVLSVFGLFGVGFARDAAGRHGPDAHRPGPLEFWDRTIGNQAGRDSPFSIWGQEPSLDWLHTAVKVFAALLALVVAFVPKRRDLVTVSALGAAVLIAVQLTIEHWFYLYIPWFLPFLFVALLAPRATETEPEPSPG